VGKKAWVLAVSEILAMVDRRIPKGMRRGLEVVIIKASSWGWWVRGLEGSMKREGC